MVMMISDGEGIMNGWVAHQMEKLPAILYPTSAISETAHHFVG